MRPPGATADPFDTPKPRLRGVSHVGAFFGALAGTIALLGRARAGAQARAVLVFGGSLVLLFGISGLYHRLEWSPQARRRMKRLDHAAVFVAMAGGYTPLLALVPTPRGGHGAVVAMWIGATIGIAKAIAWPAAPAWVSALLCVVYGWVAGSAALDRAGAVGSMTFGTFVASGVIYTVGALVYATRRPDPVPRIFGYHEVFHALVVAGTVSLFAHVGLLLASTNGAIPGPRPLLGQYDLP
jgi:hemolysin III